MKRYTVRPRGETCWAQCDTIEEARREAAFARARMEKEILIFDEEEQKLIPLYESPLD